MPEALDILRSKVSVPSELRSAQWAAVPVWIRERAFFMASVDRAEILDGFRTSVGRVASGELSVAEAREAIRGTLTKTGYQPLPGQEGTIKDLGTLARQNVAVETNLLQVQGFGRWARQQDALEGYPAQRLVRMRASNVPRDWQTRWIEALAECGISEGASGAGEMVALVNHPIWTALSAFGTPYPPFDFNSGMGIEPVDREEAESLGIVPPEAKPDEEPATDWQAMMEPLNRGLNATLEASPAVRSAGVRNALAETLQGLAQWDKERLVFTDPNGTRPYTAEALARVISQPLPEAFHDLPGKGQMQADAFVSWSQDHMQFADRGHTDQWEDLTRLIQRLEPSGRESEELFRGLTFSNNEGFSEFMAGLKRTGYSVRPSYPAESWSGSLSSARKYMAGDYQVLLRMPGGNSEARDVSPLVREFRAAIVKGEVPQGKLAVTDDEFLLPQRARIAVKKVGRVMETPAGKVVEVYLEESRK